MLFAVSSPSYNTHTHSLSPFSWEQLKCTWMAWRAAMVTAQPTQWAWQTFSEPVKRHHTFLLLWQLCKQHTFLSKRWKESLWIGVFWTGIVLTSTQSLVGSYQPLGINSRVSRVFAPVLQSFSLQTVHCAFVVGSPVYVSLVYNNRDIRGPLSRSVACVRLGRLIWAHSGPAQWTSFLCSAARLGSGLPHWQPALLQSWDRSSSSARNFVCLFKEIHRWLLVVDIFGFVCECIWFWTDCLKMTFLF